MDLVGDQVHRDVPQVTVSFSAHRLLDPAASADETRRQLKRRAFDHLLTMPGGQRLTMLPVSIAPGELPALEDLVTAAQRHL